MARKKEEIRKKRRGKGGPNKTTRGDLKGRKADLKGSEEEVLDLKKGRLKL